MLQSRASVQYAKRLHSGGYAAGVKIGRGAGIRNKKRAKQSLPVAQVN
jgi:hypothetical protein